MSAVQPFALKDEESTDVTTINANARVDYILRFSKHPAVVIGEQKSVYSTVASQFLANLPLEHNAALITATEKLTNIQLRCRIIEQLFFGALFDPEQPLYVSLMRLLKTSNEPISIVIEQAQFLTCQVLHELCQLNELLKKSTQQLNVLLLGDYRLAQLISADKATFSKRLSLVSASNGQLLPLQARFYSDQRTWFKLNSATKVALLFTGLITLTLMIFWLAAKGFINSGDAAEHVKSTEFVLPAANEAPVKPAQTTAEQSQQHAEKTVEPASSVDIYQALLTSPVAQPANNDATAPATVNDILAVLDADLAIAPQQALLLSASVATGIRENSVTRTLNPEYYVQQLTGYVIQFAVLTEQEVYQRFVEEHKNLDFVGYQRLGAKQVEMVLTSKVYPSRAIAVAAIASLPESIQRRGPWVKSIAKIAQEIRTFADAG